MNDPKILRESSDLARQGIQNRSGRYLPYLEDFLKQDQRHRALMREVEEMRNQRNAASERIGKAKAAKDEALAKKLMEEISQSKTILREKEMALETMSAQIREILLSMPNLPDQTCPIGKTPEENIEVRKGPLAPRVFDFPPLDHQAVGEKLGILDIPAAAKLSGSRFVLLREDGARLERSLINFMLDLHTRKHGYKEIWPPSLVRPEVLEGTGQLPKFKEDMYATLCSSDEDKKAKEMYLISTAEIPLTNLVREEIVDGDALPMQFTAYTPCFRQESGTYGKDTRGMIRVHQFDKVELVWIAKPEDSADALEKLTKHAATILETLEIPYRVIELCTGDLGFGSKKTYDIELWMPSENRWREVSSCSNCGDFQARRMNARFRRTPKSPPEFVHTLNGSGLAVGRTFAAILENFQQKDGTVSIPAALRPYFGADVIKPRF